MSLPARWLFPPRFCTWGQHFRNFPFLSLLFRGHQLFAPHFWFRQNCSKAPPNFLWKNGSCFSSYNFNLFSFHCYSDQSWTGGAPASWRNRGQWGKNAKTRGLKKIQQLFKQKKTKACQAKTTRFLENTTTFQAKKKQILSSKNQRLLENTTTFSSKKTKACQAKTRRFSSCYWNSWRCWDARSTPSPKQSWSLPKVNNWWWERRISNQQCVSGCGYCRYCGYCVYCERFPKNLDAGGHCYPEEIVFPDGIAAGIALTNRWNQKQFHVTHANPVPGF